METANNEIMVIVHYNVVNGGDKRGNAQASTVIYKMEDMNTATELFYACTMVDASRNLLVFRALRKQKGEWRKVYDTVNLDNVTYIEWPEEVVVHDVAGPSDC